MVGIFRLRFSGRLERDGFEAALANAVQRHPLLRATVDRKRGKRPTWIDHPDWRPEVQWQAETNECGFPSIRHIDLTQEPGTRVWVANRGDDHDVVIQAHHCCGDALGMAKMIEDLLIGYAMNQASTEGELAMPTLEPQRLIQRGVPDLTTWDSLEMERIQAMELLGARQFFIHSPVPLSGSMGSVDEASPPPTFPNPHIHSFGPSDTRRLIGAAKSLGVSVNDLLARDLFLAVGIWREKRNLGSDRDWLRFSIPVNLRTSADENMPMANSISMVFLDRQPSSFSNPSRLLKSIHKQMQKIKSLQLQYTFLLSLELSRLAPGGMSGATAANNCLSTSCLSNLGPVLTHTALPSNDGRIVSGNVVLEAVDFVIPLRPHLHAAFCVYTYAGRLCVLMHCDPRVMSDRHFRDLLDTYTHQIRRTIDAGSPLP